MHRSVFSSRFRAGIHLLLLLALTGSLFTTTGCSWFRKKKPVQTATTDQTDMSQGTTTTPNTAGPVDNTPEGPRPGSLAPLPELQVIYFDYDKANIRRDQLQNAEGNLRWLQSNPDVRVLIEGHTDERGTVEYNFALGERRAAAVRDYYLKGGIPAERLAIISKGEENPAEAGNSEAAWSHNRRAAFMRMY